MHDTDNDLRERFDEAFWDFCNSSGCRYDSAILAELWTAFVADMLAGFPSLFERRQ